jgi:hypothetical protein
VNNGEGANCEESQNNNIYVASIEVGTITNTDGNTTLDLIAKAIQDIPEGQQLFVTYGAFSNSELLRYFFQFLSLFF